MDPNQAKNYYKQTATFAVGKSSLHERMYTGIIVSSSNLDAATVCENVAREHATDFLLWYIEQNNALDELSIEELYIKFKNK